MSTSAVGKKYEDKFFAQLPSIFANMPYKIANCRFHRAKSYHSVLKDCDIKFENVVEVFKTAVDLANGAQPTLVIIFECKNYESMIGHDEIDELNGRLQHVHGVAKKAFLVTKKGFQSGALKTAQSLGFGLIRFLPQGQTVFEMNYQLTPDEVDEDARNLAGLTDPDFYSSRGDLGFFLGAGVFYFDIALLIFFSLRALQQETEIVIDETPDA